MRDSVQEHIVFNMYFDDIVTMSVWLQIWDDDRSKIKSN